VVDWLLALGAGLIAGAALVVGAAVAWIVRVPQRVVSAVMAFGSGVLISALAFDLIGEANDAGGFWATMAGFVLGSVVYVIANVVLDRKDKRNRRGSSESPGTGGGIVIGALLDGLPESAVLGLSMVGGGGVSVPILLAIAISNIPEGLSATADLKRDGRRPGYVFGLWIGITLACGIASLAGFALLEDAPAGVSAFVTAIAAGAILAMICDTMIPEAFRDEKAYTGLIATLGFFASFGIHQLAG